MAERAGIFEQEEGAALDLSSFTTQKPIKSQPAAETVRAVSEGTPFKSRESVAAPTPPAKPTVRRRRTGRSVQFNTKVTQACKDGYYEVTDGYGFQSLGETLERALEALRRELKGGDQNHLENSPRSQ